MLSETPNCRVCGDELTDENWNQSQRKSNYRICKECTSERSRLWRKANPEKYRAQVARWQKANPEKVSATNTRAHRKQGHRPFNENKECAMYLGVHVAERVLSHVFKDIQVMPMHNPGYDVICNHRKKIDIKSACQRKNGSWEFHIRRNTTADFFLCLAFDNREDLNPLHAWLMPGDKVSHRYSISVRDTKVSKWDDYRIDIEKVTTCCNELRL